MGGPRQRGQGWDWGAQAEGPCAKPENDQISEVYMVPGGQSTELEVSSWAAEGQGPLEQLEELRLSCLYCVLGAVAAGREMDWRLDGRPGAQEAG